MTICIAAFSKGGTIATVSDMMISTGDYAADMLTIKERQIHPDWHVMISGDDVTRIAPLLERIQTKLADRREEALGLAEIEHLFKTEFQEEVSMKASDLILSRYRLTMDDFLQAGLKKFGSGTFAAMKYEIDNVRLGCMFLVFGFDAKREPHIFTVEDPGECCNHDLYGFWAVGNGSNRALSSLFFHPYRAQSPQWKAVYCLCEAKFMAESAGHIGEETIVALHSPKRTIQMSMNYEPIKTLWKTSGAPKIPFMAEEIVTKLLGDFNEFTVQPQLKQSIKQSIVQTLVREK